MVLGERLRLLRKKNRFSAERLSEVCGVKAGAYRRWERNETEPSIGQALSLAREYQMTVDEMLFGDVQGNGSTVIALDVTPGENVMVRVTGRKQDTNFSYQPAVKLENSVASVEKVNQSDIKTS